MQRVWNEKDSSSLGVYLDDNYTVHLDAGDPWEGKTLDYAEFRKRLSFSFNSFPDLHFDLQMVLEDEQAVAIT